MAVVSPRKKIRPVTSHTPRNKRSETPSISHRTKIAEEDPTWWGYKSPDPRRPTSAPAAQLTPREGTENFAREWGFATATQPSESIGARPIKYRRPIWPNINIKELPEKIRKPAHNYRYAECVCGKIVPPCPLEPYNRKIPYETQHFSLNEEINRINALYQRLSVETYRQGVDVPPTESELRAKIYR